MGSLKKHNKKFFCCLRSNDGMGRWNSNGWLSDSCEVIQSTDKKKRSRDSELWSGDDGSTRSYTASSNFRSTPVGGCFTHGELNVRKTSAGCGSLVKSSLQPVTLRSRSRDSTIRPPRHSWSLLEYSSFCDPTLSGTPYSSQAQL
ncbi:hypothetical protein AVEN_143320-1 [Araneus ventricosus]|uniref:Uncharacterized protein n=1 Tax=Araneus ventricosus TaxID=182803 RepID=A0A4Y2ADT0_ARAVE|nr:hypothetical protein AVEN_143320-1 [Araneus ventricosus]